MATLIPVTSTEQLLYSTIQISTDTGSGTGFFYLYRYDNGKQVPIIVTNKHVIDNNPNISVTFSIHTGDMAKMVVDPESRSYKIFSHWIFHPTMDLCITEMNPIAQIVFASSGRYPFYYVIDPSILATNEKLLELSAVEDVLMVGYPIGLWDSLNNFPLFRRGITSSHPGVDFIDPSMGVVDMACFPGSSGSPIFINNPLGYFDKKEKKFLLGKGRFLFLGILSSGPQMSASGTISIQDIPTKQAVISQTPVMINLGYYIKAYELEYFKPLFV